MRRRFADAPSNMAVSGVLLLDRGDLPSLVALTLEARPQQVILLHLGESDLAAGCRSAAVTEHGAVFDVCRVIHDSMPDLEPGEAGTPIEGLRQAWMLVRAAAAARRLGCSRVVWPGHAGPDAEGVGRLVERANLVAALTDVDGPDQAAGELLIDLPVVDLTDEQLVDLAEDGGAPMRAFWPCTAAARRPCETCPECRRWRGAFDGAGAGWPWTAVTV